MIEIEIKAKIFDILVSIEKLQEQANILLKEKNELIKQLKN